MDNKSGAEASAPWWQVGTIYQIYPRSFQDANGDGIGDLQGIVDRLDYLSWLGVDAIWLSPIYPSPMADFGYDVSDYCDVAPVFGSMHSFDLLVSEAHRRGIRIVIDFVPNHTSDKHPWFIESRSSRASPKRDWYLWRDAKRDGSPPNNWISTFGGPAWTWEDDTGQYYGHSYLPQQPDLNWSNPAVHEVMLSVLRFWLDRRVDGFRVDVIYRLVKDAKFRDNPPNPNFTPTMRPHMALLPLHSTNRPELHKIIAQWRSLLDDYGERVLMGETNLPLPELIPFYGERGDGVHMPFNFHLISIPWEAAKIRQLVEEYEGLLPRFAWPNWVLGNHDRPRVASRIGEDQARVAGMLLLTLRGTPVIYYGEELGMQNVEIARELMQDPVEHRIPGTKRGRDPFRTPMQWDDSPNAGFSKRQPWLPIAPNWMTVNVASEAADPQSMLTLYRRLLESRRTPALTFGSYKSLRTNEALVAYVRSTGREQYLVTLNLSSDGQRFRFPSSIGRGEVVLSTHLDREGPVNAWVDLRPHEGLLIRL